MVESERAIKLYSFYRPY